MSNLYEQLPTLIELQETDAQIRQLQDQYDSFPTRLKKLEQQLAKQREAQEARGEELGILQKEHRSQTRALEDNQEKIKKYQLQRLQVKTNREYQALENEISHLEDENAFLEDSILELLLRMDEVQQALQEETETFEKYEVAFQKKCASLKREARKLHRQIEEYQEKRKALYRSGHLDPGLLKHYDAWTTRKKTALVAVVDGNSCGACHITLRPQLINLLHHRADLITCASCSRILYLQPEQTEDPESEPV